MEEERINEANRVMRDSDSVVERCFDGRNYVERRFA